MLVCICCVCVLLVCTSASPCINVCVLVRHEKIENSAPHQKVAEAALLESDKSSGIIYNMLRMCECVCVCVSVVLWGGHQRDKRMKKWRSCAKRQVGAPHRFIAG